MRLAGLGETQELVATASIFHEPCGCSICGMPFADFGFFKLLTTVESGYHEHLYDGVTKKTYKRVAALPSSIVGRISVKV